MIESFQIVFQALGLTLVHFIWQGALIALVATGLSRALSGLTPRGRYGISLGALLAMAATAVATLAWELVSLSRGEDVLANEIAPLNAQLTAAVLPQGFDIMTLLPWIDAIWAGGVLLLSARMVSGLLAIHRLRAGARDVPDALAARFDRTVRSLGLQHVRIRMHAGIDSPFVVGIVRSVVYLPVSAVTTLSPEQIDAVLVHELEHIRRGDFAWNLLQTLIETLFFYHPAVWWLGRTLREQRELACDDAAVRSCKDPLTYATALLRLEEQRRTTPHLAVALNGNEAGPSLLSRIRRILGEAAPKATQGASAMKPRLPRPALLAVPLVLATLAALTVPAAQVVAATGGSFARACRIKTDVAPSPNASVSLEHLGDTDSIAADETPAAAATASDVEPEGFWSGLMTQTDSPDTEDFREVDGKPVRIRTHVEDGNSWTWVEDVEHWASDFAAGETARRAALEGLTQAAAETRLEADRMQAQDSLQADQLRAAADRMAAQARAMEDNIKAQARNAEAMQRNSELQARQTERIAAQADRAARKVAAEADRVARRLEMKFRKDWPDDMAPPEPVAPADPAPPAPPPAPPAPPARPAPVARPAAVVRVNPTVAVIAPVKVRLNRQVSSQVYTLTINPQPVVAEPSVDVKTNIAVSVKAES